MLQLSLNFLERQLERLRPARPARTRVDHAIAWKSGITVHLVFRPRARRYLLRLLPDGSVRLVIPRRGTEAEGLRFLERSERWLLKRREQWKSSSRERAPWAEGRRFLFRGEEVALRMENEAGRTALRFADQVIPLSHPLVDLRDTVQRHLRKLAERELPIRTRELAGLHNITTTRISVRGQKTRWGSCSARGTISLNWRLIHAPAHVVDYLIIQLMHRREMNHSARYWKHVAAACPDYRLAEKRLKEFRLEALD
jgi:predicted metal-dependent hydrolase